MLRDPISRFQHRSGRTCGFFYSALQNCISAGSGEKMSSDFKASVLCHNNSPHWNEMAKVSACCELVHFCESLRLNV